MASHSQLAELHHHMLKKRVGEGGSNDSPSFVGSKKLIFKLIDLTSPGPTNDANVLNEEIR